MHLNDKELICLSPAERYSDAIRVLKRVTQKKAVWRALLPNGKAMPAVGISSVSSDIEWDPEITSYEDEDTRVTNARTEEKKLKKIAWKEPIIMILKKKLEAETKYAAPKGLRFGKRKETTNYQVRCDEQLIKKMCKSFDVKIETIVEKKKIRVAPKSIIEDTEMREAKSLRKIRGQKSMQASFKKEIQNSMERMKKRRFKQLGPYWIQHQHQIPGVWQTVM